MAGPLTPGSRVMPLSPQDPATQLNTFKSYVVIIADPAPNIIEKKLKAAQELCESFEMIGSLPQYPQFLAESLRVFLKILQDGEPTFIAEYHNQQLRKLLLEIIHRIPANDHLKSFVPGILSLMFKLLETDNEENALVCLRIIIELNKQFRPQFTPEVTQFLKYVKEIYKKLPNCLPKIFEHRMQLKVRDMNELNIETALDEVFTSTTIMTEKKNTENQNISFNLIPKADLSLKVLAELPIIVVLMYQLYKQQVHNDVSEFIPLIMNTINMQPALQQRTSPSFNKEVFVDFIAAQIKTLSFLAYIIRIYQESINVHSTHMVKGMLGLLTLCPQEVAHLRKELLIAARHILATDLRMKFVPCIEKLFDESVLIGTGWTTYESLRPLAYSTLADLVHHIRQSLSLTDLALAVNLFSKNVHDDSLPCSIQNMSCKLLLNLVECIRSKSEVENGNGRELFLRMLEVFVLKFKTIAETQLPYLIQKCRQLENGKSGAAGGGGGGTSQSSSVSPTPQGGGPSTSSSALQAAASSSVPGTSSSSSSSSLMPELKEECKTPSIGSFNAACLTPGAAALGLGGLTGDKDETKAPNKPGSFCNPTPNYSVVDCRGLVKTLVSGVKTITWGISSCKTPTMDISLIQSKQFFPKETLVYIRLVEYALQALDIYMINVSQMGQTFIRSAAGQPVRSKEEKEVLEHFAGVFIMMSPMTFKEIFHTTIEYVVDRIHSNFALQIVANSFLANVTTSATFATILVEYLLKRMEEMGSNVERSCLYLKLFKLVFGSVSLLANENEQMLKPHLHTIVNLSMELARTAKEPFNYFLLLRALFRSIGGGSHDLLYQEFLPLLPNLLQGLNSLQSGLHKQHMKDLFVELCLTVPVRLSSLLPYLPMLMDPLVSALNGSQTLISQGLRTLELCVDNLQPDFLFSHIQPVRAELMQALWRCLNNSPDSTAQVAFRVLGKFGGSNRKMLQEPQKLNYNERESVGPCVTIYFQESTKVPVALPVQGAVEVAFNLLKNVNVDVFYRKQAWEVIRGFLVASMNLDEDQNLQNHLFSHSSFADKEPKSRSNSLYICSDHHTRAVQEKALTAMFVAATVKELSSSVMPFLVGIVTHYALVALSQQAGPFALTNDKLNKMNGLDPHVLIDALASVMGNDERELCVPGTKALSVLLKVSTVVLGSKEKACQLPLFEYLAEKVSNMCYERAWYTKMGGGVTIKFFCEHMSLKWILDHQLVFLQGLLFIIMDLTGEVSNGTLDMAKGNVDQMLRLCSREIKMEEANSALLETQKKSLYDVVRELIRQITSPNQLVREQVTYTLSVLSETTGKSITEIIEPHKDVIADMVPPKKHLLRYQPPIAQIGIMEGNAFCLALEPRLVTIDLTIVEHKLFFNELHSMCDADDSLLLKLHCYKNVTSFVPIRKSAIRVLSACHYLTDMRNRIFEILYKSLNSEHAELQQTAHECMKKFISGFSIDIVLVHTAMRPLLTTLSDYSNLTLNRIQVLSSLTQIFPNLFNEKLCEQLLAHLKKWFDFAANPQKATTPVRINGQVLPNELKICASIIEIFSLIPSASQKLMEPLTTLMLKGEKDLFIEAGSPFRPPLMKFLLRYPEATIDLFFSENKVQDQQWNRFFEWLLRQSDGKSFREVLMNNPNRILSLIHAPVKGNEFEFLVILIINILVSSDENWLLKQEQIIANLLNIWISPEFHEKHRKTDTIDFPLWQEPHLLLEILLSYFKHHQTEVQLLFHLLRCFTGRYIPQFQFFKEFLDDTIAQTYFIEWKRRAFFKFVDIFRDPSWSQDLKAKILQYVLIPCFSNSFEKEEGEKLIGGPPSPEQENNDNIISVFINNIIDPDNPFGTSDAVRILVLQFSSLLVAQASHHIHDAANKKQGNKLRRLMTFAWPCLLPKTCVDPATKYHGHLLLSHIIAKFAIHKRIVLQVFHSLLKAHALEARTVVRQALEILTPAMPGRMEDGNTMLTHWTKKIIVEEGHTVAQLVHILQLIVRHFKVYYPVRHHLIQHIVSSIQKLGLTPNATVEHKKLAVDLAEVVIKWEGQRVKEDSEELTFPQTSKTITEVNKPIDKQYCDTVVNFLLKVACQVNEVSGSPGDLLSRRCIGLMKKALSADVWPNCELKLAWFDKILMSVEGQTPNFSTICTALELLTFLLGILRKDLILSSFKPLQRGIAACMTCPNSRVIRMVHTLLSRLMSIFPTESATSNVASKYEELECLYACVSKVVYEGLTNYEKVSSGSPSQLFGTMMILKAACNYNASYIDRLITSFMRVLQRMAREHLAPTSPDLTHITSELLILSLDLVKNRVGVMSPEMRKSFLGTILVSLIDRTTDPKVMKAIMKMVEDWVKNKSQVAINQSPAIRERAFLLMKLMSNVEKRFPDDTELNAQFLELIHHLYKDDSLKNTDLASKLEPAFLAGLRCTQPHIRQQFVELFDNSVKRRLSDRLLYMISTQNWESMGNHFWIKQCIELVLSVAVSGFSVQSANPMGLLPSTTNVINMADSHDRTSFYMLTKMKEEPMDVQTVEGDEDEMDLELSRILADESSPMDTSSKQQLDPQQDMKQNVRLYIQRQTKFLADCRDIKTTMVLNALIQLCHHSAQLAHDIWILLFPRAWKILSERSQHNLSLAFVPFLSSGSHISQKDSQPNSISTFVEAISHCVPPIHVRPCVLKYLAKSHCIWHRVLLMMEQSVVDSGGFGQQVVRAVQSAATLQYEFEPAISTKQETLDSLCELYKLLKEEDMMTAVWQKRAKYHETSLALAYEQHGFFDQAQQSYEGAMTKARIDFNNSTVSVSDVAELNLLEERWIRCSKELGQWESLSEFATSRGNANPQLVLECSWRIPKTNWGLMKEALTQVEQSCPKELAWKVNLYRGYLSICHPEEHHLNMIERLVEMSSNLAIKEWRLLPRIISQAHVGLLQASHLVMELQEAASLSLNLQPTTIAREQSVHDMKAIVKTWRNRLPMIADDLSHWSDVFTWREHQFQSVATLYEGLGQQDQPNANHSMLGIHHTAIGMVHFGKISRKHGLTNVALDSLSKIHAIPSVPVVDCFHKIRQQVKCYLQMAGVMGKNELQEGLEVIESTNLKYFSKEMTAEFFALKGTFLAHMGKSDEANKSFSAAVQTFDTLVKAWALWGDYLETIFTRDRNITTGASAVTCFLHACRHQNEGKSRKYLAKVLWLLTYDDEKQTLTECVDKYGPTVPPIQWLPWVPQLLSCLVRNEGRLILNLLSKIGSIYPQAVYFPIRTLYLTLKIEHRERCKSTEQVYPTLTRPSTAVPSSGIDSSNTSTTPSASAAASQMMKSNTDDANSVTSHANIPEAIGQPQVFTSGTTATPTNPNPICIMIPTTPSLGDPGPIRAPTPMWRCSRVMHVQRDNQTTVLSSLEGIVDQMVWFRENWHEEVLRQLRQGLAKCYAVAFENRGSVNEAAITPHTLNFMRKLVTTFGVGVENGSSVSTTYSSAASESLARRMQATAEDPIFQRMKNQFTADFDFTIPGSTKLHNLINKLKKWIKILEAKIKLLPSSFLLEERCRFLSTFTLNTAEVELPGEFLVPKHSHYYVKIERFLPKVDIVHKHNTAARRLYIRGHNGKIYPFLVVNDACMTESRREERVLQLLRFLNHFLGKQKETCRRQLNFAVPRVIPFSPQMRFVEDNPASISLLDIYKQRCSKSAIEHDMPIARYYERLATIQARGSQPSHQVLREILKEVQANMVPRGLLKEWALHRFPDATDYWMFRKNITNHLAVWGFAEFILHLTRMNPDMMYLHQDSGFMNLSYFKFDTDDQTGDLNANRPVPFRLTPNIADFLTTVGITGPLTAAMVAAARCFVYPQYKLSSYLSAILRDEYITWHKKKLEELNSGSGNSPPDLEGEVLIQMVNKAVQAIMTRLQNLAMFDGAESRVSTLIAAANSPDNLCRMDPAWHPWL